MKTNNSRIEPLRRYGPRGSNNGAFVFLGPVGRKLKIIASDGAGWDHVSVSLMNQPSKTPTWGEMAAVKDLFFSPLEPVMQLHPPEPDYVNDHDGCLHLWRPQSDAEIHAIRKEWGTEWPDEWLRLKSPGNIPLPPPILVGRGRKLNQPKTSP